MFELGNIYCLKYAETRTFSNLYFPAYGQNGIRIFLYLENTHTVLSIRESTDQRRIVFRHISRSETNQKKKTVVKPLNFASFGQFREN